MRELEYPFDPSQILRRRKALRGTLLEDGRPRLPKRIAVLGGSTTSDIIKTMELFLLDAGIQPEFYESEYGQFYQDALFPPQQLLDFQPELVFVHTTSRNITHWPQLSDSPQAVEEKLAEELGKFRAVWDSLAETFHCPIIQNNFEKPFYRVLGSRDGWDPHGRGQFTARLNQAFAAFAQEHEGFYIHDIDYLSADFGLRRWADPACWNLYKYALCLEAIPAFASAAASLIKALFGGRKKVLALDLDNTLWGGVVGDDGVDGIEIGQENGVAQSYYEFQSYVKELSASGVLLAVCSKNDEDNALSGLRHPEGLLRPEDFTVVKANWENKDRNLAAIAQELNLLPESLVFADDNPAEREIVRAQLPGAAVPDMEGVENYIAAIDRNGWFEAPSLSQDDLRRGEMYQANAQRAAQQARFGDYQEYLKSLEMQAVIGDFLPLYLPRITQLTNKSNQFNLTTRRYTLPQMEQIAQDPSYIRLFGKLTDKFGDNGVVSVVLAHVEGHAADLELWLMSCRVLKRDMELAMLDALAEQCRARGVQVLRGHYLPTAKNTMVKDLYPSFGFAKTSEDPSGATHWELSLAGYAPRCQVIAAAPPEGRENNAEKG